MERHAVLRLHAAEVLEQGRELVHTPVEFRVGELDGLLVLELGHPDESVLAAARLEVPVDAVDAGVEPAPDPPLEEGRGRRVKDRVPLLVPGQKLGVFLEALREVLLGEALPDRRIVRVRDLLQALGRRDVLLLTPVDGDLRLGDLDSLNGSQRAHLLVRTKLRRAHRDGGPASHRTTGY